MEENLKELLQEISKRCIFASSKISKRCKRHCSMKRKIYQQLLDWKKKMLKSADIHPPKRGFPCTFPVVMPNLSSNSVIFLIVMK